MVGNVSKTILWVTGLAVWMGMGGCTPAQYARQADKAALGAVTGGQKAALGQTCAFGIAYEPYSPGSDGMIRLGQKEIPVGTGHKPVSLTLGECLQIAFRNSRSFQTSKERLYVQALAVSTARRDWDWTQYGGDLNSTVETAKTGDEHSVSRGVSGPNATIERQFANGGLLLLGAAMDITTDFAGNTTVGSLLDTQFTQPLLRGAWQDFAYEQQYRLERDFLFAVFDYERLRQTFASDVTTRYYAVVQQRDQLENERANITRLRQTLALTQTLVQAGASPGYERDEAEQNLLNAMVRLERDEQQYRNALDVFKISLGLPIQSAVELDYPGALEALAAKGPLPVPYDDEHKAIAVAFSTRPDVLTEQARFRDAQRDVEIAANRFLPFLDVTVGTATPSTPQRDFTRMQFEDTTRFAALNLRYELDQTDNRDAYRLAMINAERAQRNLSEFMDQVRLDVRRAYRELIQSRRSYELQIKSVELARRRRSLTYLEQQAGRASARDALDAEDALRQAQNGLTNALVSYTTTRLAFLGMLGLLSVDETGVLFERNEPFTFERIGKTYDYVVPKP